MQSSPLISVIIVVWNSKAYLATCLSKLGIQTFQDFEIILIDNGSDDGALDNLEESYPSLHLKTKRLDTNHGFAVANNIGARLARGQWLALLNADAFPEPDWLENLLKTVKDHPDFSCFSSRQIQVKNPGYLDGTGDAYHVSGVAWRRNIDDPSNQFGDKLEEIFSPCAAAALYWRDAYLEVGGFDEDFFSYFEDVDLGFRLRLSGYRALYVPDAVVYHVGSATLGMNSDFSLYYSHRNLVWTFFKNMPTNLFVRYFPAHIIVNLSYLLVYVISGRGKVLWKAKWDAICGLPSILKKRKNIQQTRRVTNNELVRSMERGWMQSYIRSFRHRYNLIKLHVGGSQHR